MEFNSFHNPIKMEGAAGPAGWSVSATTPPHSDPKKVNPFMQWAIFNSGIYFAPGTGGQAQPGPGSQTGSTPPSDLSGSGGGTSKQEPVPDQSRPASVTVTQTDSGGGGARQPQGAGVNMAPGHYNHSLHPMVPVDPGVAHHQQQQQQQHHQQHHQQQQQHQLQQQAQLAQQGAEQQTNDTAFPGHHRASHYSVGGPGAGQMLQNNVHKPQSAIKSTPTALTKNKLYTEENGEVITFNGSQEHMEMTRRGVKIERVYECKDCDKAFTREEHLKRHAKSHSDEPVHRCEVAGCPKAYTRKERLTRHYKVAHLGQEPERPFFCGICGKDFQRKEHLTRHQKNLHGAGVPGGGGLHAQVGGAGDTDGPISMTVLTSLNTNTHHAPGPGTHNHAGAAHSGSGTNNPNSQQGLLHCTYEGCPKTYSRREHLNRHIKLHMGIEPERPYYCMECGKTFTRKEHLMRHRRSHTGETPFACPDCNKQFARKEHLKRHMRVHTGEHPYPCQECGRSFGRRERLIKHLKSHGIGVMPGLRPQYQQPKKIEFKKEPEFNTEYSETGHTMTHGVFGNTDHLLRMIAQKGPLSPAELGMPQQEQVFNNPEVARALSNPDVIKAFQNPDVVKAFALSPPKKSATSPGGSLSHVTLTTVPATQTPPPVTQRGPDIANSPSVPPELSKLPSTFSIFPVVPSSGAGQVQVTQPEQVYAVTNPGYQQTQASYVTQTPGAAHRTELTTIPMAAWPGTWVQPVMRSPAKLEPGTEAGAPKHWESATAAAYFRAPFP